MRVATGRPSDLVPVVFDRRRPLGGCGDRIRLGRRWHEVVDDPTFESVSTAAPCRPSEVHTSLGRSDRSDEVRLAGEA